MMLSQLFVKDEKFLDKLDVLDACEEIITKKTIVFELILQAAKESKQAKESTSVIPLLCESYFMLGKLQNLLSRMIIEHADKARVKVHEDDKLIYTAYFMSIAEVSKKLRFEHSIMLSPVKNVS